MNLQTEQNGAALGTRDARTETSPATDPIRVYLDLATRWDAMSKEVDGLVSRLTRAAERLRGTAWRNVRLGSHSFPAEIAQQTVEPWPSGEDLGAKMARWHELKTELNSAWALLSAEDRRHLKDPPQ